MRVEAWMLRYAVAASLLAAPGCVSSTVGTGAGDAGDGGALGDGGGDGGDAAKGDLGAELSLRVAVPCSDSGDEVYVTPAGLPPLSGVEQGDVVRCHRDTDQDLDVVGLEAVLADKKIPIGPVSSGAEVYRVAFRTRRADQRAATSTARVYLPTVPRALPLPVVVVGHPTEGMADACAPSRKPGSLTDLALPWVARGYAVIAPDFAGLGNEGVPAYIDNRDQGQALLDGARALRKLVAPGGFGPQVVVAGFSQGGGAALSAQALAGSYGADGDLVAVVAFAPQWPIRYNSFALVTMMRNPSTLLSYDPTGTSLSFSNHVIWAQRAYGFLANFSALTTFGGAAFPAATATAMLADMDSLCGVVVIGAALYLSAHPPFGATNGDLFDPSFRLAFLACVDDPNAAACTGLGREMYEYLGRNHLPADPAGAPVLYVQGLSDTVLPPEREAACIVQKMQTEGLSPTVCADGPGLHSNVTERNIVHAIAWVEERLGGGSAPPCPSPASLPPPVCD